MKNPWEYRMGRDLVETADAESRIDQVKKMDPDQLRAVIAWPGTQKTVRLRAESRLRRLQREGYEL